MNFTFEEQDDGNILLADDNNRIIVSKLFWDKFLFVSNVVPTKDITVKKIAEITTWLVIKKDNENEYILINKEPSFNEQCDWLNKENVEDFQKYKQKLLILLNNK